MTEQVAPWRIPHSFPVIPGESLDGYVARVAAENLFPSTLAITKLAGAEHASRPNASLCEPNGLALMADCLNMAPETILGLAYTHTVDGRRRNFMGHQINRRFFELKRRRFSPASLKISAHHRNLWALRCFPFCEESWEYLSDTCPNDYCGAIQRWYSAVGVDLCDQCAEPLTRVTVKAVPEAWRSNLRSAVGLVHPDGSRRRASRKHVSAELRHLSTGDLLDLMRALCIVVDPNLRNRVQKRSIDLTKRPEDITAAMAEAWGMVTDWPNKILALFASRINEGSVGRGDGNRNASLHFMSLHKSQEMPETVLQIVDDLVHRCRSASSQGYLVRKAATMTGATMSGLVEKRRAGLIPTVVAYCTTGDRLFPLLDKDVIDMMARNRHPYERLARASAQLGIPSYSLLELAQAGSIEASVPPPGRSTAPNFARRSLEAFADDVYVKASRRVIENPITLSAAMSGFGLRLKPWASVLLALKAGHLPIGIISNDGGKPAGLAKRLRISKENAHLIERFIVEEKLATTISHISVSEAAEVLNMGYSAAMEVLGQSPGKTKYLAIPLELAMSTAQRVISAREASIRMRIAPQSFAKIARESGVPRLAKAVYCRASAESLVL